MIEDIEWRRDEKNPKKLILWACDLSGRWFPVPVVEYTDELSDKE